MKQTKEQLLALNGELRFKIETLEKLITDKDSEVAKKDKEIREYLSISLGAGTRSKGRYDSEQEQIVYSWYSIFREIGKLLAKKEYPDLSEAIQHHTMQISGLQERMDKLDGPDYKHR